MKRLLIGISFLGAVLISGCGGSGSGVTNGPPNNSSRVYAGALTNSSVQLGDGSYADPYVATATSAGTASASLYSSAFPPYLLVYSVNSDGTLGNKVAETGRSGASTSTSRTLLPSA